MCCRNCKNLKKLKFLRLLYACGEEYAAINPIRFRKEVEELLTTWVTEHNRNRNCKNLETSIDVLRRLQSGFWPSHKNNTMENNWKRCVHEKMMGRINELYEETESIVKTREIDNIFLCSRKDWTKSSPSPTLCTIYTQVMKEAWKWARRGIVLVNSKFWSLVYVDVIRVRAGNHDVKAWNFPTERKLSLK